MMPTLHRALRLAILLQVPATLAVAAGVAEEMVSFVTHDGLTIEGYLSYPENEPGPFPAMLLIPGSGLHDADVTINEPTLAITRGTQKLFRPVARHFSRNGWAVLRYNKRGASFDHRDDDPSVLENSTLDDLTEDARNALQALHGHPKVAARPLVVYGHSEGTFVAASLAREQDEIDLLVLVGSAGRSIRAILDYQLVERNVHFLREAADANGDGTVTLDEFNALDGDFGLGSIYVQNVADLLFRLSRRPDGSLQVDGIDPQTDTNGDGDLGISSEIEPALVREAERFADLARSGALGRYWRSILRAKSTRSFIHRVKAPILFVHGALDVQTPIDEALVLMEKLESRGRTDYDILILSKLGHSLSKPNDFFTGDGGLTVLDNLTLNAPKKKVRQKLLRRIETNLAN